MKGAKKMSINLVDQKKIQLTKMLRQHGIKDEKTLRKFRIFLGKTIGYFTRLGERRAKAYSTVESH